MRPMLTPEQAERTSRCVPSPRPSPPSPSRPWPWPNPPPGTTSRAACGPPMRSCWRSGIVSIEAPERAEDAAIVPMSIGLDLPEGDARRVERVTLVVDENPRAGGRDLHARRGGRGGRDLHPPARQRLLADPRRGRAVGRLAPCGGAFREGFGRLLGARAQGPRRGDGEPRAHEAAPVRGGGRPRGGAAADPAPQQLGAPARSGHALLHPRALRGGAHDRAGRRG